MAAKITEPSVGDSTWASGNHKCTGSIGILTLKETKNKHHKRCSKKKFISEYHKTGMMVVPKLM